MAPRSMVLPGLALLGIAKAQSSTLMFEIDTSASIATIPPTFLSLGWEMEQMFNYMDDFSDARYIAAASSLAPAIVRIGGISCDFITYTVPGHPHPAPTPAPSTWSWQGAAQNFTTAQFQSVLGFLNASGLRLLWDLNELVGRECTNAQPGGGGDTWCLGDWASGNARDFLQWVHDEGLYGPGSTLAGISAGNELRWHLDPAANTADILELAGILEDIWGPTGAPPLYATDTDDCYDNETRAIMTNLSASGRLAAFTFHAYPGGSGTAPHTLPELNLNSTWLRTGIMSGSDADNCLGWWRELVDGGSSLGIAVTESSSSWNASLPPPAQDTFVNGFFSLAEWGQYARTGAQFLARWAFSESSPFATIFRNGSRWDVAADYWPMVLHKRIVGGRVLNITGGDGPVLAYAHCGTAGNGSVVVLAVNPTTETFSLDFGAVAATPRVEYVLTAPGGDVGAPAPLLNGPGSGPPLRLLPDGTLPSMSGRWVSAGGPQVSMPPLSQAFFVLLAAEADACQGSSTYINM